MKIFNIILVSLLMWALLPIQASSSQQEGGQNVIFGSKKPIYHKITVDSQDGFALGMLIKRNAILVADYPSFSVWKATDEQLVNLVGRNSVEIRDDFNMMYMGVKPFNTQAEKEPDVLANLQQQRTDDYQLWMIQFAAPPRSEWLAELNKIGINMVQPHPPLGQTVWANGEQIRQLEEIVKKGGFLQWTGAFHPYYRILPALLKRNPNDLIKIVVTIYNIPEAQQTIEQMGRLANHPLTVFSKTPNQRHYELELKADRIIQTAALPHVLYVDYDREFEMHDDSQGQIAAVNTTLSNSKPRYR